MKETTNCIYKTPCGWCSKWDKECDKKIHKSTESVDRYSLATVVVKKCESELDHEWECIAISTDKMTYWCKKCGARKTIPMDYSFYNELTMSVPKNDIPNCCKTCLNHPSNGGSGVCMCTLHYFAQDWTCTATSNTTKLTF